MQFGKNLAFKTGPAELQPICQSLLKEFSTEKNYTVIIFSSTHKTFPVCEIYLEVWRNNDFSRRDLQHYGLSFKKPQVPLGVIGQQGPGQQLHQQSVEARLPAGELHLHGTVPLGQWLQHRPAGAKVSCCYRES